ncbi:MAG: O-antigen ligase family protein [Chitinophagaceae bacterium]
MLLLFAVAVGFIFHYILTKKKYLEGVTLLMAFGIGVFLVFKFFPQTLNRFKELTHTQFDYSSRGAESHYNMEVTADQWNGANFRLAAWRCGWDLFLQHPLIGVGLGDKQDELVKEYAKKGFQFGIDTKKNVHNNYLDVLISTGIIGFAVFIVAWLGLPLYYSARQRDWLAVLIISSIGVAIFTEVYFDRTVGGMIVGFFVPFLLTDYRHKAT